MDRSTLEKKPLAELREIASTLQLRGYQRMRKADLVSLIMEAGSAGESTSGADGDDADAAPAQSATATPAAAATEPGGGARAPRDGRPFRTRAARHEQAARSGDDGAAPGDDVGRSTAEGAPAGRGDAGRDAVGRGDSDRGGAGRDRGDRAGGGDVARPPGPQGSDDDADGDGGRARRERRRKPRGAPNAQQDGFEDAEVREGVLDLLPEGYGFLRVTGYLAGHKDVYVSQSLVRRLDLRRGDLVAGPIRRNKNNDKFPALARVDTVDGEVMDQQGATERRPVFGDLTPLTPSQRFALDRGDASRDVRLTEIVAPLARGHRGLVAAPERTGKTSLLRQYATAIEAVDPDVHVMMLLVDQRPEEVTDVERSTRAEVIASTFDRTPEDHTQIAELAVERAKRLVERGRDVVVLIDSITRLSRAYNLVVPASGRTLGGSMDVAALTAVKRLYSAARRMEEGGSLTILATALTDTGSRADQVIFDELAGTANVEIRLDRGLQRLRLFPALDVNASAAQREDLLLDDAEREASWSLRRTTASMEPREALEWLLGEVEATSSNAQLLGASR